MMSGRFWLISILAVLATVLVGFRVLSQSPEEVLEQNISEVVPSHDGLETMYVGDEVVYVEVADESEEMKRGLSFRESMEKDEGMLFVYPSAVQPRFWMNEMQFSLDFLWIREGVVVEIMENVPHPLDDDQDLPLFSASELVDMVLEVNAGWVNAHGVEVGDLVSFLDSF